MAKAISSLTANPLGRLLFKAIKPIVHAVRRAKNPGVPSEQMFASAEYRGRQFQVRIRRWNEADRAAIDQCFTERQYAFPEGAHGEFLDRTYEDIVASGRKPLIIDCGANIGASVLWFHARYPEAHIVGIEPAPENFQLLQANCAGLDVDLREAGVAAKDGRAYLASRINDMGFHTSEQDTGLSINLISLGTLLREKSESEYVPFLLKIDIEGAESDLFTGDWPLFDRFPLIILEPHDWLLPGEFSSGTFFRFHADRGREFGMKYENVASIAMPRKAAAANPLA